jgi:hypothetical protein
VNSCSRSTNIRWLGNIRWSAGECRGPLPAEPWPAAPYQRTSGDQEIFADQQENIEVLLLQQIREQLLQINEQQVIREYSLISRRIKRSFSYSRTRTSWSRSTNIRWLGNIRWSAGEYRGPSPAADQEPADPDQQTSGD